MTPERLRECQDILLYSSQQLADLLGRSDARRVRRWTTGQREIPDDVAAWLEGLVRYFETHPPPQASGRAREDE